MVLFEFLEWEVGYMSMYAYIGRSVRKEGGRHAKKQKEKQKLVRV